MYLGSKTMAYLILSGTYFELNFNILFTFTVIVLIIIAVNIQSYNRPENNLRKEEFDPQLEPEMI